MLPNVGKVLLFTLATVLLAGFSAASGNAPPEAKTAILLASFGTTVPSGVKALDSITEQVR